MLRWFVVVDTNFSFGYFPTQSSAFLRGALLKSHSSRPPHRKLFPINFWDSSRFAGRQVARSSTTVNWPSHSPPSTWTRMSARRYPAWRRPRRSCATGSRTRCSSPCRASTRPSKSASTSLKATAGIVHRWRRKVGILILVPYFKKVSYLQHLNWYLNWWHYNL